MNSKPYTKKLIATLCGVPALAFCALLAGCGEQPQHRTHTLFLVDGTDGITAEQTQYMKDNYLSYSELKWNFQGDQFSLVLMDGRKPSLLRVETLEAPMDYEIPWWLGGTRDKRKRKEFQEELSEKFLEFIEKEKMGDAPNSLLIETLADLTRNKRFKFTSEKWHSRKLVFISDLYQNSPEISFFDKCTTYEKVLNNNSKYMKDNLADFNENDQIEIYHFNLKGRDSECAQNFWSDYFKKSNIQTDDEDKYKVTVEKNPPS